MSAKRILYLCYDGLTDPLGQSQVLPYLTKLSEQGFDITIISCEKSDKYLKLKTIIENICQKNRIHWQPIKYFQTIPFFSQTYTLYTVFKAAKKLHFTQPFQIVHGRSYVVSIVALALKRQLGLKFIFDTRGFWHEERIGHFRNHFLLKYIFNYFDKKEKQFLAEADSIITLNETAKAEISQRKEFLSRSKLIDVIPCCVDYDVFMPATEGVKKNVRKALNIDEKATVLGYVGSIGDSLYMLGEMLDFYRTMQNQVENAWFLIITQGSESEIREKAQRKGIFQDKIIVRPANRTEVAEYLKAADFAISFIMPYYEKRGCSPTKMGEYFALNLPVVVNDGVGDVSKIVRDTEGGVIIKGFDAESYTLAINELMKLKNSEKNIREASKKYYDLKNGVATYCKIYTEI